MLPSFHDGRIVGYEVECEVRRIRLQIRPAVADAEPASVRTVVFTGVEGYHFRNDTFGNIVLYLEAVTLTRFLSHYWDELAESYRTSGAPGAWASDIETAPRFLSERGLQAFVLSSSYGLSGWVLAREASVILAEAAAPRD